MIERPHKRRLQVIVFFGFLFVACIIYKLVSVQIIHAEYYQKKAKIQHERIIKLEPNRGTIYDRKGRKLAINLSVDSYGYDCSKKKHIKKLAWLFSTITDENYSELYGKIKNYKSHRWVARKVSKRHRKLIESWKIPGLYRVEETRRYYPYGSSLCHVLGFTDVDNQGIEGIELLLNKTLNGTHGETILQIDARGYLQPNFRIPLKRPVDGNSIVLSIDAVYQNIVEEELKRAIDACKGKGGIGIIMHPRTGELLAMANFPNYDPNSAGRYARTLSRNRAVTDVYEPGSTFKLVTIGSALEANVLDHNDKVYCENGKMKLYNTIIHDTHKYDWITYEDVIVKSSNIGTAKMAVLVGKKDLYKYARSFGYGTKTGIQLPGEVRGVLRNPTKWSKLSLSMISFGQEVSATTLQVIDSYAAIANDGVLLKPIIVKKIVNPQGGIIQEFATKKIRRVVLPEVAQTVSKILQKVVDEGTGINTRIEGISIAGKTGTAQKSEPGKGYKTGKYVTSFVGYLPVEDPQLVCLIAIDEPRTGYYASAIAVPAFKRVIERILDLPHSDLKKRFFKSVPIILEQQHKIVRVPDLINYSIEKAQKKMLAKKLFIEHVGVGKHVLAQYPLPNTYIPIQSTVKLITQGLLPSAKRISDVRGLSLRKALARMSSLAIPCTIKGSGVVVKQSPLPGTVVSDKTICSLICESQI